MDKIPKGYTCSACEKFNKFSGYVYAHWDIDLTHECSCGAKYIILHGKASKLDLSLMNRKYEVDDAIN